MGFLLVLVLRFVILFVLVILRLLLVVQERLAWDGERLRRDERHHLTSVVTVTASRTFAASSALTGAGSGDFPNFDNPRDTEYPADAPVSMATPFVTRSPSPLYSPSTTSTRPIKLGTRASMNSLDFIPGVMGSPLHHGTLDRRPRRTYMPAPLLSRIRLAPSG